MNKDGGNLIFEIADTLSMDVKRIALSGAGCLTGSARFEVSFMEGMDWPLLPTIKDSGVYPNSLKAGVLLHVAGALHVLLLVNGQWVKEGRSELWVLDGTRLGWARHTPLLVFPTGWNRVKLYRAIEAGVVAAYTRSLRSTQWDFVESPQQVMREYCATKEKTKAEEVADDIRARLGRDSVVSDRFRTKGPRDFKEKEGE